MQEVAVVVARADRSVLRESFLGSVISIPLLAVEYGAVQHAHGAWVQLQCNGEYLGIKSLPQQTL
jgi:hypothetical protein